MTTRLDDFLSAVDLDDLQRISSTIESLTPEESARIEGVLREWRDHQAVANVLFHPAFIPEVTCEEAVERALRSDDFPYLKLAATVGLQHVDAQRLTGVRRSEWIAALVGFLDSSAAVLAARASVTLHGWAREGGAEEAARAIACRYPAGNADVARNMLATILFLLDLLPTDGVARRLHEWQVPDHRREAILKEYSDYLQLKERDSFAASLRTHVLFAYIPNLHESERYGLSPVGRHGAKPWWRFW